MFDATIRGLKLLAMLFVIISVAQIFVMLAVLQQLLDIKAQISVLANLSAIRN